MTAKSSARIKPTELKLAPLRAGGGTVHRIALHDRTAVATGSSCFATSDGTAFQRRATPGTSYGLFAIDGVLYSMGGPFACSTDAGETWRTLKRPFDGYIFTLLRDSAGTWWMGCDEGTVLTSARPDKNWKPAKFTMPGKVMAFAEVDGKLLVVGAGCGVWDGKKLSPIKGLKKAQTITRLTESPAGTLIAIGDGGIAYRSADRGRSFVPVKSGVTADLEDLAWVAGSLFVVGGNWGGGVMLRSDDDGKTFKRVPVKTGKLWTIASWGDGAFVGGDAGIYRLASPKDTYWQGATDRFAPAPAKIDTQFAPLAARSETERIAKAETLHAAAVAEHARLATTQRTSRARDANPALAQAIDESVEGAEQIYADWLQEQGDPRGDLAQLQLRLAKEPKHKELAKAEKELLKQRAPALLGKLAVVADMIRLEWHAGFIAKARIANTFERHDAGPAANKREKASVEEVLGWLLDSPSGRFLRELTIGIVDFEDNDYGGVAKVLGKRYLPALRTLFLGDFRSEETELNWSSLGNLEPMYPALPRLETLKLRSGSMKLGTIVLPNLRHFEVITGGMDAKAIKSIASAVWPRLETLSLQIGPQPEGAAVEVKHLYPILEGDTLPLVRRLGIANFDLTGQLVEPLAASKLLPQLAELDLTMGTLGDDSVARMFALQKAFAHLTRLDVDDNYISGEGKRLLEQARLAVHFGEQRDDDGDPSERYGSAYE